MRTIYLLRGAPSSGKSTWVKENNLEQYTLSSDNIRLMYQSPVLDKDGNFVITQENDGQVWKFLFKMLEDRMQRGEFIIIDATHYKSSLLSRYKELISKYRYRAFVVDFTDIPLEELIKRNENRSPYKRVPEATIRKMHAVFEQDEEVSKRFNIISREEAISKLNDSLIYDYNNYEKVVFFGDIHGCYEPLKTYFEASPMNDKTAYIFLGDYIDRGIQNKEVLEFLISIKDNKNVLLLEGNHDRWLRMYAECSGAELPMDKEDVKVLKKYVGKDFFYEYNKNKIRSSEFINNTIPQIQDISNKDLRQLCRKFGQMAFFEFGGKKYFACHGGIPRTPNIFISSEEMIKGTGKYEDTESLYKAWKENNWSDYVLIHGHRNIFDIPAKATDNCYNLCSNIEVGADLRVLELINKLEGGIYRVTEEVKLIPNPVFNEELLKKPERVDSLETKSDNEILKALNESKLVQKKVLDGGIVSYNFKRMVFHKRLWTDTTCKARGLFVDAKTKKVIARSYEKFGNWGEFEETKSETLKKNLVFPVLAYRKENGFLAMISYNWNTDDLLVCSKSTNQGEFVDMIKEELDKLPSGNIDYITQYLKQHNVTMVCECINQDKDPHIIKYAKNKLYLLDLIYNEFEYKKVSYNEAKDFAFYAGLQHKVLDYKFNTWEELYSFKKEQDSSYDVRYEGWVFEDANGFMVKYKTRYYKFWKYMRGIKERLQQGNNVKKIFSSEDEVRVFNLLKSIEQEELQRLSIIDIAQIYYNLRILDTTLRRNEDTLSNNDWNQLQESISNPQPNVKLVEFMKEENELEE